MDMRRMEHKERMMDLREKEMEYEIAIMQRFKTKEELEHFYDIMAKTKALTTSAMAQPEDAGNKRVNARIEHCLGDEELYATERSRAYEAEMNNLRRLCKTALKIREILIEEGIMSADQLDMDLTKVKRRTKPAASAEELKMRKGIMRRKNNPEVMIEAHQRGC